MNRINKWETYFKNGVRHVESRDSDARKQNVFSFYFLAFYTIYLLFFTQSILITLSSSSIVIGYMNYFNIYLVDRRNVVMFEVWQFNQNDRKTRTLLRLAAMTVPREIRNIISGHCINFCKESV